MPHVKHIEQLQDRIDHLERRLEQRDATVAILADRLYAEKAETLRLRTRVTHLLTFLPWKA